MNCNQKSRCVLAHRLFYADNYISMSKCSKASGIRGLLPFSAAVFRKNKYPERTETLSGSDIFLLFMFCVRAEALSLSLFDRVSDQDVDDERQDQGTCHGEAAFGEVNVIFILDQPGPQQDEDH